MSDKNKICAIGEKKLIDGKWYEKAAATNECDNCVFLELGACPNGASNDLGTAIEDGGVECMGTIWIDCDQPQPETQAVEECAGCRFWNRLQARQCRRFPKGEVKQANEWCGEWKA